MRKAVWLLQNNVSTLTMYAVQTRYPGLDDPISDKEYHEALMLAECVVKWAEEEIHIRQLQR